MKPKEITKGKMDKTDGPGRRQKIEVDTPPSIEWKRVGKWLKGKGLRISIVVQECGNCWTERS